MEYLNLVPFCTTQPTRRGIPNTLNITSQGKIQD